MKLTDRSKRLIREFYTGVAEKDWPAWAAEAIEELEVIHQRSDRGNRSSGTVADYLVGLSKGETCAVIGDRFGVSGSAVRKALKARGFPLTSREYLRQKHAEGAKP